MAEPEQFYVRFPFAESGDRVAIPNDADPGGSVSFFQGFGPDYERNPEDDPQAKRVPRDGMNELFFLAFQNIRQYQLAGYPQFVTAVMNGGSPVLYPYGARVRFDGKVWASVVDDNNGVPGVSENWVVDEPFSFELHKATLNETLQGLRDDKLITPQKYVQATREQPFSYAVASGGANALTASFSPPIQRLIAGLFIHVRISQTNTGDVTLDVDGLGPVPVRGIGGVELPASTLVGGAILSVVFNGEYWSTVNLSRATKTQYGVTRYSTLSETTEGARDDLATTPAMAAAAAQAGNWLFATSVTGTAAAFRADLTPAPQTVGPGTMFSFVATQANANGVSLRLNNTSALPLEWSDGSALTANEIMAGDQLTVLNIGTAWRVINTAAATTARKGTVRLASAAALTAGTDAAAAVPASLFAPGVRATLLTGLTLAIGGAISAADSVLSSLGKLQNQVSKRGILDEPNGWTGANYFDAGALFVRGGANNEKAINFADTGTNTLRAKFGAAANVLFWRIFGGGLQVGEDLQFNGNRLSLSGVAERRFINRTEAASVAQVAARESWEVYVTPASLAGLQGVLIGSVGIWSVYTSGRARWAVASGSKTGFYDVPVGLFASGTAIVGNGATGALTSLSNGFNVLQITSVMSRPEGGGSGSSGQSAGGSGRNFGWTCIILGVAGNLEVGS